jgi:tRNA-specific 2-thiouridylase
VGPREALAAPRLTLKETNWLGDEATVEAAAAAGAAVLARVRSTRPPARARLELYRNEIQVVFDTPEEAVSPGQACVLYDAAEPSRVLGGGFIANTALTPR